MKYNSQKVRTLIDATEELESWEPEVPALGPAIILCARQIRDLYVELKGAVPVDLELDLAKREKAPFKLSSLLGLALMHFKLLNFSGGCTYNKHDDQPTDTAADE